MPRSRLMSTCPPGAIRLVPTLMTTRIVMGCGRGRIHFLFGAKDSSLEYPAGRFLRPSGEGQHLYPAVRMAFWQGEKSSGVADLCLPPMPPAAFPTAWRTMSATGQG